MRRSCCSNCCCRCCCKPLGPLVAQSACWCRGYMQRRLRGGHGKLTASSSSRERSAHDWKQHQQQQRREKRQKKFETESQMPKEPRDHDGFVAGVRVRVRVRVWGSSSSTSGSGSSSSNGSNTVSRPVLFSPVGSWCVIKADDDYTHLHAFFVCPSPAPPCLPPSLPVLPALACPTGSRPRAEPAHCQLATRRQSRSCCCCCCPSFCCPPPWLPQLPQLVACIIIMRMRTVGHII